MLRVNEPLVHLDFHPLVTSLMARILLSRFAHWNQEKLVMVVEEFVKYAHLAIFYTGKHALPCSAEVDEVWHAFILETREYKKFCESILPGSFLHHVKPMGEESGHQGSLPDLSDSLDEHLTFLASYIMNFGPFTDESISHWLPALTLMESFDWSLQDLNTFCSSLNKISVLK